MKAAYIKTQFKTIINVSKIVTLHYYEFDKNFSFEGEKHDFWEMVYIDKGMVEIKREDKKEIFSQGEIIFHKPNEFHSIKAVDSSPNFFVVSFVCTSPAIQYFENFSTLLNKKLQPFIASIIRESELTYSIPKNDPSLKKLEKKESAIIGGEQLIKTSLEQLFIYLIRDITKSEKSDLVPTTESMDNHLIVSAKEYIKTNLDKPFHVLNLCKTLGYSKSYISKIFKLQTGMSLANYAIQQKIIVAKEYIRSNNYNFSQISDRLAFDNPQYFSRVFKRVTNMTPTEFKQTLNVEK